MVDSLGELAAVLLAISLASERFVVLCKTLAPNWLASESDVGPATAATPKSKEQERSRRLKVIALGFVSSYVTVAVLAGSGWPWARIDMAGQSWFIPLLAFLATGGSAFWAQVVGYTSALKDVQRLQRSNIESESAEEPPLTGSLARRATAHLRRLHPDAEFLPSGDVQSTSAGVRIVHLRQTSGGIPVLGSGVSVRFGMDGGVRRVKGSPVAIAASSPTAPRHTATQGTRRALEEAAKVASLRGGVGDARVLRQFAGPSRPTVLAAGGLQDEVQAELSYWPEGAEARLAWVVHILLPGHQGEWEFILATDRAGVMELLHHRRTVAHASSCVLHDFDPDGARVTRSLPVDRGDYVIPSHGPLPPSFGFDWISKEATEGNNVVCYRHNSKDTLDGTDTGDGIHFELPKADREQESQQLLNAFYWCNWLHDFFLLLGFDEKARNFQDVNLGDGEGGDRVVVRVFQKGFAGIASMRSRLDGKPPELKLGPRQGRHAALDAEVVIHEFVHGVTNRLIGGEDHRDPLRWRQQSEAMGEGYSDYFALTIVNHLRHTAGQAESLAYARWISANPQTGLRKRSYAGDVGTAENLGEEDWKKPHDAGQVWAKALLEVQQVLHGGVGRTQGDALGWQMVVDSLKLLTPNGRWPNMLDGRDALYDAFDDLVDAGRVPGNAQSMRGKIRAVFSSLLLGDSATSDGSDYKHLEPGG